MRKNSINLLRTGTMLMFLSALLIAAGGSLSAVQYEGTTVFNVDASDRFIAFSYIIDQVTTEAHVVALERELFGSNRGSKAKDPVYSKITYSAGNSMDVFSRSLVHTNGTDSLSYNVYKDAANTLILKNFTNYNGLDDVLFHEFPSVFVPYGEFLTQTKTHTYYLRIPADQFLPVGTYSDSLTLDLYLTPSNKAPDEPPSLPADGTLTVGISVDVLAYTGLSVTAGTVYDTEQNAVTLGFGDNMAPYDQRSVNVIARSNVPFKITASSEHDGNMKHTILEETVGYSLRFNTVPIEMAGSSLEPVEVLSSSQMTSSTGSLYPLEITLNQFPAVPHGIYRDNISLEITAN